MTTRQNFGNDEGEVQVSLMNLFLFLPVKLKISFFPFLLGKPCGYLKIINPFARYEVVVHYIKQMMIHLNIQKMFGSNCDD